MVMQACAKDEEDKWPFLYIDTTKPVEERFRRCLKTIIPVDPNRQPTMDADNQWNQRKRKREDVGVDNSLLQQDTMENQKKKKQAKIM
jgi:hypothetical protein